MNGHSKIRNKGIANIFSQMGLVEAWGSGIKRILNAAEEYGLPKPKFQEFDNMFRVELFRVNPITDQANQATNQANQDLERLDQVEDENVLSEKEIEILNLVRMQPSITQKEMANGLHFQTHPFFYSKKYPVPTAITHTVFCGNVFFRLQSC